MNSREFLLGRGDCAQKIEFASQLTTHLEAASAASSGVLTLELRTGEPPKRWEKIVYPLLGLKVPISATVLAVYWNGEQALATFEDGEKEWVAKSETASTTDTAVQLKTEAGELFSMPSKDCIRKENALRLMKEFFEIKKRPISTKWTTAKAVRS